MSTPAAPPAPVPQQVPLPSQGFNRHALGMPAGSVRAMLALGILLYLWVMALATAKGGEPLLGQPYATASFIYLQLIMVLVMCHFLVGHGHSIGAGVSRHSPLWLPRGTIRLVLLVGYFGLAYWTWRNRADFGKVQVEDLEWVIIVTAVVMAAFVAGHAGTGVTRWMAGGRTPPWALDVQAWFSLIALILLAWILLARLIINPTFVKPIDGEPDKRLTLQYSEAAMAAFVAFYFGARS